MSLSRQFPTVAIDLRGWGQSSGPEPRHTAQDYSIIPMASDVVSVLDHLRNNPKTNALFGNGIILIGHSMGAKVALATLRGISDDRLALIKGIVLVAPAPPTPLVLPAEMSEQQRGAYSTEESVQWTVQNVLSNTENLTDADRSMVIRDSLAGNVLAKDGWILHGMQEDISSVLGEVASRPPHNGKAIKFIVLAGELDVVEQKDRVYSDVVQALTGQGFDVTFTVLDGVKHLFPLEKPDAVRQAISLVSC